MVHRIIGWCKGYVLVKIPGQQSERFINLCRNHGIYWWNLQWNQKQGTVSGCLSRRDYYKLRPLVQKTRVFPLVIKRYGGLFWLQRAGRRLSFWWGVTCFLAILFFMSSRIWGIYVEGQSYHSRESILRYLESDGIYGGMSADQVVCSQIEADIREDFQDVGWASIEKTGSKLYVRMEEVVLVENEKKEEAGSLIAEQEGKIISIVTKKGTAKVRAGDVVKKSQTLISGKVKVIGDNEQVVSRKAVQAQGTVVLQCREKYTDVLEKEYQKKEYTGRKLNLYQIALGGKNLFLYNPLNYLETYEKYDIIREGGQLCPSISLRFPVSVWKRTYREIKYLPARYTRQEAEQLLTERYEYYLEQMREKECFDISGELQVNETTTGFEGNTVIIYSKVQNTYKEIKAPRKKGTRKKESYLDTDTIQNG